jgi:hypothetical protein
MILMTFDKPYIPRSFATALLGGLLYILQNSPKNQPLPICASSDFLLWVLVKDRIKYEMDMLNPGFELLQAVFAASNERSGRIQFKKVETNPAKCALSLTKINVEIDTEIDLMFNCQGIPIYRGSQ